jgi:hypothetical protein
MARLSLPGGPRTLRRVLKRRFRGGCGVVGYPSALGMRWVARLCGGFPEAVHGRKEGKTGHRRKGTVRIGTLEYWNIGILGRVYTAPPIIPSFHYSIIPLFHRNSRRRRPLVGGSSVFPPTKDVSPGRGGTVLGSWTRRQANRASSPLNRPLLLSSLGSSVLGGFAMRGLPLPAPSGGIGVSTLYLDDAQGASKAANGAKASTQHWPPSSSWPPSAASKAARGSKVSTPRGRLRGCARRSGPAWDRAPGSPIS